MKKILQKVDWFFLQRKSLHILLLGILIAVGIAIWPQALCAAQNCNSPRDQWCGGTTNNPRCCAGATGFEVVYNCRTERPPNGAPYCAEDVTSVDVRCSDPANCAATWISAYGSRLVGGNWYVGSCSRTSTGECSRLNTNTRGHPATCCAAGSRAGDGGGEDNPPVCTPSFTPPVIGDNFQHTPPFPIPWGQEQLPFGNALGVTISGITATGGQDTTCNSEQRQNITSLKVRISLQAGSQAWIMNELAQRYYGAHVLGTYPQSPETPPAGNPALSCQAAQQIGFGTPNARLDCQWFRPLDPGNYDVIVQACQADGKCTERTLPSPLVVRMLETTITQP